MPSSRRLVRRQPLLERIKAYLDPADFLLWLSEELETSDWEQWEKAWALPLGVALNLLMLIARANSGRRSSAYDDVFGEATPSAGFFAWLATMAAYLLSFASFSNAVYTFTRKRHYRLFESSIDEPLSTPSARRVKVQSSPASSSPLRYLSSMMPEGARSRAHPDPQKDVWELSIWDPIPVCLKMFCLFSPGHVLVYWLFLPTTPLDARPSTTAITTLVLAALLSMQLNVLKTSFSQQSKDNAIVHREVLHEYDKKYVHPRTQHRMRDVGTQCSSREPALDSVEAFTPVTVVNQAFSTRPNPNYSRHVDPDGVRDTPSRPSMEVRSPTFQTPLSMRDFSSPLPRTAIRQPQYRASTGGGGDGGNLGIYTHAQSPLKKSASTTFSPMNQAIKRVQGSPKRRESGRL